MTKAIYPIQLLTELSGSGGIGCLSVDGSSASWRIYVKEGELKYAECSVQSLVQLDYYLRRLGLNEAFGALKEMSEEFPRINEEHSFGDPFKKGPYRQAIAWLQSKECLDGAETVQLLKEITQDALESFLWLSEGTASWDNWAENPSLVETKVGRKTNFDLIDTVKVLQQRLKGWQRCAPALWSPHQRPYLLDYSHINKPVRSGTLSVPALSKLAQLMRGFSLRQISLILKQDEVHLGQLLSPYIHHKIIYLYNPQSPFDRLPKVLRLQQRQQTEPHTNEVKKVAKTYKIVCVDDSPTILNEIQRFLEEEKFHVTAVDDPIHASSVIFRIKPDLILLDITMPKINGYKLCGLLRSSSVFDNTPIIMVTGNAGLIDQARAKLVGATDYLTKPFSQEGLKAMVTRHLEQLEPVNRL